MRPEALRLGDDAAGLLGRILTLLGPRYELGVELTDLRDRATEVASAGGYVALCFLPPEPDHRTKQDTKEDTEWTPLDPDGVISQRQAAAEIGKSSKTIQRWLDNGTLPTTLEGGVRRVRRGDLKKCLSRPGPAAAPPSPRSALSSTTNREDH